jgi:hypothetical protein
VYVLVFIVFAVNGVYIETHDYPLERLCKQAVPIVRTWAEVRGVEYHLTTCRRRMML